MPFVQVVHTIQAVTATVPFGMIMLLDHIKRKTIPPEMRVRMIFPSNGLQSTSYWDVEDKDALQAWLDEYLGDDCTNSISEIQEDFAWGISAGLNTARGAEVVSARTVQTMRSVSKKTSEVTKDLSAVASTKYAELDAKYDITGNASKTYSVAKEKTAEVGKVVGSMKNRAMQNERVSKTVTGVGTATGAAWTKVGQGFGFLRNKIGEVSDTVFASVQEYNSADTLQGGSSLTEEEASKMADVTKAELAAPPESTFKGFDEEEVKGSPAPAPAPPQAADSLSPVAVDPPAPSYTIDDDSEDLGGKDEFENDAPELPSSGLEEALGEMEAELGVTAPASAPSLPASTPSGVDDLLGPMESLPTPSAEES